jgi:trimethylamine---corrinoid protein Co-methyltransferase
MMLTASYEQCVIDNEIMGATFRMLKGVEVNDDSLSINLLKKVGPKTGHFLTFKETSDYVRKNYWIPQLTNRDVWSVWEAAGSKDMRKSANEIVRKILDENTEPVITMEQTKEINAMANSYHKKALERLKKGNG